MSQPESGRRAASARFNTEMGFTYRIEEGLGLGWGWHADKLSVPGTGFPHASAMLTYADTLLGLLSSGRHRAASVTDRRPALPSSSPRRRAGPIEMEARLLKIGRTTSLGTPSFSVPGADVTLRDLRRYVHRLAASGRLQPFEPFLAGSAEAAERPASR